MTVSRPCYFGNLLLGVVGVDVNLAYILEDVTYYQDSLASYTFLIDNKGQSPSVEGAASLDPEWEFCIPGCRKGVNSCRDWISQGSKAQSLLQLAVGSSSSCYSCTTKYGPFFFFFFTFFSECICSLSSREQPTIRRMR